MSGDRTITTENVSSPRAFLLTTNSVVKWGEGIHYRNKRFVGRESVGHLAFADGSVRRLGQMDLGNLVRVSSPVTNRIEIP